MAEEKKGSLAEALVAAQAEMPKVEKRGKNPHFKNEYVTLDDLLDAVRPVLNRHGIAVVQMPTFVATTGAPALTTTLLHTSGEKLETSVPLILQKDDMQGMGAAITYARRYMLAAALGIAEGTDDDGNQAPGSRDRGDYIPPTRIEPRAKRPESWAELAAGFDALEVDPSWLQQAVYAYLGKATAELGQKEKELAFQLLASVLMRLQDGMHGLPETVGGFSRGQLQRAFAALLGGTVLEGPAWAVGMERADNSGRMSRSEWEAAQAPGEDPSIEFGEPVKA